MSTFKQLYLQCSLFYVEVGTTIYALNLSESCQNYMSHKPLECIGGKCAASQCLCARVPRKRKLDGSIPTSELRCVANFAFPNVVVVQVNKSHLLRYLLYGRRNS